MMKPRHIVLFLTIPVLLASLLSRLSPFTAKVKSLKARPLSINLQAHEDIQPSAFGSYYIGGFDSGILYEITWSPKLEVIDTLKPILTLNSISGIAVVEVFHPDDGSEEILGERLLLCDPSQGLIEALVYRRYVQGEYRFVEATHELILNEAEGRPIVLCDAVRSKADTSGNVHVVLTDASRMSIKYIYQEIIANPSGRILYLNLTDLQYRRSARPDSNVLNIANSIVRVIRDKASYPIGVEIVDVLNERVKFLCVEAFGPYITEYNYEIPTGETLARNMVKNGIVGNNVTPLSPRLPHRWELVQGAPKQVPLPAFEAMYLIAVPHAFSGLMKLVTWLVKPLRFFLSPFLPFSYEYELGNFPFSPPGGVAILNRTSGDVIGIFIAGENEEDLRGTSSALVVNASSTGRQLSVLLGAPLKTSPMRLGLLNLEDLNTF